LLNGRDHEIEVKPRGARGYEVGDIVWVRETYSEVHPIAVQPGRFSREGRAGMPALRTGGGRSFRVVYKIDGEVLPHWRSRDFPFARLDGPEEGAVIERPWRACWDPSVVMPVWASRLTFVVKSAEHRRDRQILGVEVHRENLDDYLDRMGLYDQMPDLPFWPGLPKSPAFRKWRQNWSETWAGLAA